MGIAHVGLPVEALVQRAYEQVGDSSTKDLRAAVDRIEKNNEMKEKLRTMQKQLALFKQAFKSGKHWDGVKAYNSLKSAAANAGFSAESEVMKSLNSMPMQWPSGNPRITSLNDDQKQQWDDWFKSAETILDAESQSYGDIGQQLQFELTQANNVFTRTTKAQSDLQAKYDRTANGIIGNIKG